MLDHHAPRPDRLRLLAAFAAVYLIWGSTYLAIRIAVETLPPLMMAGARFLVAGLLLYGWTVARGVPHPGRRAWLAAAVVGILLLVGGNGMVTWGEQRVPSGLTALLIASEPLWIVLLDWARPGGQRPSAAVGLGVVLGFAGVALLIGPRVVDTRGTDLISILAILAAAISWAAGSLYARSAPLSPVGAQASGMQMLVGGLLLTLMGLGMHEPQRLATTSISVRSAVAVGYLVIFGSLVAFTAYAWLVKHTTTTNAATYAYVNPVVAVLLGALVLSEPLTLRTMIAAAIIVGSVVVITRRAAIPAGSPNSALTTQTTEAGAVEQSSH